MNLSEQKIFLVDLLSLSPFYDRYLFEALVKRISNLRLYATTFPYEASYWNSVPVKRADGLVDQVARLNIKNKSWRRALQVVEYTTNWLKLIHRTRKQQAAVVHIQWLPLLEVSDIELWGIRQLSRAGAAVVYTAHNALPHDSGEQLITRYRNAYSEMNRILVHTEVERNRLVSEIGVMPDQIDIVPHGPMLHDLPRVDRALAREELGIAADDEVILFVGLLRPYKGVEDLLSAITKLAKSRPRIKLLVAGQGEAGFVTKLHRLIAELQIKQHVLFIDHYVPVAEMPKLYASADVTVLPYRNASQSGALFTAASFNVPLVATTVGGIDETLAGRDCARLVPPSDPTALAAAIQDLLEEPEEERYALAKRLNQLANEQCNWDIAAERTIAAYARASNGVE